MFTGCLKVVDSKEDDEMGFGSGHASLDFIKDTLQTYGSLVTLLNMQNEKLLENDLKERYMRHLANLKVVRFSDEEAYDWREMLNGTEWKAFDTDIRKLNPGKVVAREEDSNVAKTIAKHLALIYECVLSSKIVETEAALCVAGMVRIPGDHLQFVNMSVIVGKFGARIISIDSSVSINQRKNLEDFVDFWFVETQHRYDKLEWHVASHPRKDALGACMTRLDPLEEER